MDKIRSFLDEIPIFAHREKYEACGMFSFEHIITAIFCIIVLVAILVWVFRRDIKLNSERFLRASAIIVTFLEVFKIFLNVLFGDNHIDGWFPLSFCSLFTYSLWMAGYGKGSVKRAGEVFMAYGCPIGGVAFMIFPATSLTAFPIWHFFSVFSMFFHTFMIVLGVYTFMCEERLSVRAYAHYAVFVGAFATVAICINTAYGSNLMNLRRPFNIPIDALHIMYEAMPISYTALVIFGYLSLPAVMYLILGRLSKSKA